MRKNIFSRVNFYGVTNIQKICGANNNVELIPRDTFIRKIIDDRALNLV